MSKSSTAQHCGCAVAVWVSAGWAGLDWICREWVWTYRCAECGDHVTASTVGCEVGGMSCQLLRWKGALTMNLKTTRDTAMTLIHWCNGFCFAGSPLNVYESSMGLVIPSEVYGWLEYWGEKSGLVWFEGKRGDVGTERDLKFGSRMVKRMAVKGIAGRRP